MSNNDSVEKEAATIEDAVAEALAHLGVRKDDVTVEVITAPRGGVLGIGSRNARVRVTRKGAQGSSGGQGAPSRSREDGQGGAARNRGRGNQRRGRGDGRQQFAQSEKPPPSTTATAAPTSGPPTDEDAGAAGRKSADLDEQHREAISILQQILEKMGEQGEVQKVEVDAETVEIEIKGDGSGILIGRHGQTLDALEYLVNRILARRIKDAAPISLETEAYRARRRQQLHRMALSMGEKAKREHKPVRLEPMPPRDRRVIHLALKDDPMITTRSAGEGVMRAI
ncbi:MAG TPA: RNA-binding cell elongation regulator Jag/EloR, partial [Candidatus Binatus sp.]|nr:RNA-binding cell elongation regulator Jag/EloR [Candidatus Binatus sp.]